MPKEQTEGGTEAQAEFENMSLEQLNAKKQELQQEFDKLVYEDYAESQKALEEKFPDIAETEQDIKEVQEQQLEAIDRGAMSLAQVKEAVMNVDTSRMPFVDSSMKKLKSVMGSPEMDQLVKIDSRINEISGQKSKIDEQIKIQEAREDIKAA